MGMLERIKKKQYEGFKEFVLNMETTGALKRQQILIAGILEDPILMTYVMKNLRNINDILNLPSEEIEKVLLGQEQILGILAKAISDFPTEKVEEFYKSAPQFSSKIRDEMSYLQEVSPADRESARFYLLKVARKLQKEESIIGFKWELPPQGVFEMKTYKDGPITIHFESGVLAAEGEMLKNKRSNLWKHYYDSGKLMASGEYVEGLKVNEWVFYYGSGALRSKGRYRADLKQGTWKEWDRSGVESAHEYHEGVRKD